MRDQGLDPRESALDQFVTEEKELTSVQQFVDQVVHRGPWWAMSFVLHVVALWVMYQWPVSMAQDRPIVTNVPIKLITTGPICGYGPPEPPDPDPPIKEPPVFDLKDVPLDVPIEDIPISDRPVSREPSAGNDNDRSTGTGIGPGSGIDDLNIPGGGEQQAMDWRPVESIDPPSNTPVFGVLDPTKHGIPDVGISSDRLTRRGKKFRGPRYEEGPTVRSESCVNAGLVWLAKAQEADGHWDCKAWDGGGNYDVGMTGLALLTFMGAGYTHTSGKYRAVVSKGLDWLRYNQKPNGAFGYVTFYEQGIATMAVSEAYGMTRAESVRTVAQRAVDFICQTQPDHGGFRYAGAVPKDEGDMSVTGWQIMAIKSAICSDLNVPIQAVDRSREFLKNTLREYGGSAYIVSQPNATPAMSAIGMLAREFLGGDYDAEINAAANSLMEQQKKAGAPNGAQKDVLVSDLYYTYYSVLAMFQMGGEYWTQWNKMFRDPLVGLQETKTILDGRGRFVRGSWDPKDTMWGAQGGRVFSTAMAVLSLEVYYRFLPVYKK